MAESLHMGHDGDYGVLLHNKNECSISEIKELVSQFGKPVRVWPITGKTQVFVHFKEYEEARACLNKLKDDPLFYALPARPRESRVYNQNEFSRYRSLPRNFKDRESSQVNQTSRSKSTVREPSLVKETLRSKSSVQKRDDRTADSGEPTKTVRFSRSPKPKTLARRKERIEKSCLDAEQLLKDYQSEERPPPVVHISDEHAEYAIELCGAAIATEVFLYNLHPCITEGQIFSICSNFVCILSVRLQYHEFNDLPFNIAFVQLRSHDDANTLKGALDKKALRGKRLGVGFVSDFY